MRLILTLAALAAALPAGAQDGGEPPYSVDYRTCLANGAAAAGNMRAVAACSDAELARQDARLNLIYRAVMARLDPGQQAGLRAQERAWIGERDRLCRRPRPGSGASAGLVHLDCMLRETARRIGWLQRYQP